MLIFLQYPENVTILCQALQQVYIKHLYEDFFPVFELLLFCLRKYICVSELSTPRLELFSGRPLQKSLKVPVSTINYHRTDLMKIVSECKAPGECIVFIDAK